VYIPTHIIPFLQIEHSRSYGYFKTVLLESSRHILLYLWGVHTESK
jgi:hypothetical protein